MLYKAQRTGILRRARITAGTLQSVTLVFPRCRAARTVGWEQLVRYDGSKVDQPWRVDATAPVWGIPMHSYETE